MPKIGFDRTPYGLAAANDEPADVGASHSVGPLPLLVAPEASADAVVGGVRLANIRREPLARQDLLAHDVNEGDVVEGGPRHVKLKLVRGAASPPSR